MTQRLPVADNNDNNDKDIQLVSLGTLEQTIFLNAKYF